MLVVVYNIFGYLVISTSGATNKSKDITLTVDSPHVKLMYMLLESSYPSWNLYLIFPKTI